MKVSYGIDVMEENDPYVDAAEEAVRSASEGLVPGKFLVEFFPFLRHIPSWIPGASSQRLFQKWQAAGERLKNFPFEYVQNSMVCGRARNIATGSWYVVFTHIWHNS